MRRFLPILIFSCAILIFVGVRFFERVRSPGSPDTTTEPPHYWLLLHREKGEETLFLGRPGDRSRSEVMRVFQVKMGNPEQSPFPHPELAGKAYYVLTGKEELSPWSAYAPYILPLDVPRDDAGQFAPPEGSDVVLSCSDACYWNLPAEGFGLHGDRDDPAVWNEAYPGTSGGIVHKTADITFLYDLLSPAGSEIRYYVE